MLKISPPVAATLGVVVLTLLGLAIKNASPTETEVHDGRTILVSMPWAEPRQFLLNTEMQEQEVLTGELKVAGDKPFSRNLVDLSQTLQALEVDLAAGTQAEGKNDEGTRRDSGNLIDKIFQLSPEERLTRLAQYRQTLQNLKSAEALTSSLDPGYTIEQIKFPTTLLRSHQNTAKTGIIKIQILPPESEEFIPNSYINIISRIALSDKYSNSTNWMIANRVYKYSHLNIKGNDIRIPYGDLKNADLDNINQIFEREDSIVDQMGALIHTFRHVAQQVKNLKESDPAKATAREFGAFIMEGKTGCDLNKDVTATDYYHKYESISGSIRIDNSDSGKYLDILRRNDANSPYEIRNIAILSRAHGPYLTRILQNLLDGRKLKPEVEQPVRDAIQELADTEGAAYDVATAMADFRAALADTEGFKPDGWDNCEEDSIKEARSNLVPSSLVSGILNKFRKAPPLVLNVDAGGLGVSRANESDNSRQNIGQFGVNHGEYQLSARFRAERNGSMAAGLTDVTMVPFKGFGVNWDAPGYSFPNTATSFGWLIPGDLVSAGSSVEAVTTSAEVEVPALWTQVELIVMTNWVEPKQVADAMGGPVPRAERNPIYVVHLRRGQADDDLLVDWLLRELGAPSEVVGLDVSSVSPENVSRCTKTMHLTIKGANAWQSPRVYVNGHSTKFLGLSPDLTQLEVEADFDPDELSGDGDVVPVTISTDAGTFEKSIKLINNDCHPSSAPTALAPAAAPTSVAGEAAKQGGGH